MDVVEAARPATALDAAAVVALAARQERELGPMRGGALWSATHRLSPNSEGTVTAMLADPDLAVFVGTIDDAVVGFAVLGVRTLRTGERLATVHELFVEADARAVGVGEAIVEQVLERARRAGCVGVDAGVLPGHRAAKNFFEGSGFTARALTMHHSLVEDS